jgi:HK97 gp10 family phage protein
MASGKAFVGVEIVGTEEVMAILREIAPKEARKLARATIYCIAARCTKLAKLRAPVDEGNLKKSIYTKSEKSPPDKPRATVRFRPEGYYWRFVEYGTKKGNKLSRRPFLLPARLEVKSKITEYAREEFQIKLSKRINSALRAQAKRNGV